MERPAKPRTAPTEELESAEKQPGPVKDRSALALLTLLLLCLVGGYRLFVQALDTDPLGAPPWPAVLIAALAGISLLAGRATSFWVWLTRTGNRLLPIEAPSDRAASFSRLIRGPALLGSFLLIIYVLWALPHLAPQADHLLVALAWFTSITLYLIAVIPLTRPHLNWRAWWPAHRRLVGPVILIILVALILRAWHVESIPYTLAGDEGSQGLEAVRVLKGEIRNPFGTGWLGVPTMSFFFNSISIAWLGQTVLALRLPWVLVGTATVLTSFWLVRQLKGTRMALLTAMLLATYHYHIHFSRLGSNQVADPFFMSLALLFLYRALVGNRHRDWTLTGLVIGLALYFYAGARLTPVVIVGVLAYAFVRQPGHFWIRYRLGLLLALGAFLVTAGPILQYSLRFPEEFNARVNQVGIIQSGWLIRETEIRGEGVLPILSDQFRRVALAFNFYQDRTVWYGLRHPLLDPWFGMLFLAGLGYASLRLIGSDADAPLAPMVAWWWAAMLLGGMLTESPPSSQRLITLSVPVCFFIALALSELVRLATEALRGVPARALLALAVAAFGLVSLDTYFVDYTPQRIYGGRHAQLATAIVPSLNELDSSHRFFFVGPPAMYWGFATIPYLAPDARGEDVIEPLVEFVTADLVSAERGAVFIFLPRRLDELADARRIFPQGQLQDIYSPVDGRLLVTLYKIPPSTRSP